ncbi:MAG: hypothetical protein Kow0091_09100 [Geminocystis sp.]
MGECLASALNIKKDENFNDKWLHTSVSVLIPAHNEERVISQTLKTIIPQLKSTDNIIVIADNCTDCTVAVVENMGVKIIERQNDLLKGKGYALDFGVNYLRENPPDVVIFIDADCNVEQNAIASLLIFFGIFIAWVKFAREELTLTTLMKIPLYILWKIPLYFKFLFKRENQWIRTERDDI